MSGVQKIRGAVRRVPVLGTAARYAKRLVAMPWNFHKFLAAWSAEPPAAAARRAAADAAYASVTAVHDVRHMLNGDLRNLNAALSDDVWTAARSLAADVTAAADGLHRDLMTEIIKLNETHAACYDRLNDTLLAQAAEIRDLSARVRDLSADRPDAGPTLVLRAG